MGDRVGVQTDLVAFLLACIEEDAQAAREVGRGSPWGIAETKPPRWGEDSPDTEIIGDGKPIATFNEEYGGYLTALHMERWDPDRVLVECDTKRRIIEMFPEGAPKVDGLGNFEGFTARDCGEHRTVGGRAWCHDCGEWCYPDAPCVRCHGVSPVLRLMAVVYKDRPGYVEAWAPDGR